MRPWPNNSLMKPNFLNCIKKFSSFQRYNIVKEDENKTPHSGETLTVERPSKDSQQR